MMMMMMMMCIKVVCMYQYWYIFALMQIGLMKMEEQLLPLIMVENISGLTNL